MKHLKNNGSQRIKWNWPKVKKKIYGIFFVSLLLVWQITALLFGGFATASADIGLKYMPEIYIKSDGSITGYLELQSEEFQPPEYINRTGNVYTLTADIEGYSVRIDASNIVFDGAGHTIHASGAFANSGLRLLQVTGVTVKDLTVIGDRYVSIFLVGSKCSIMNVQTDALRVNSESGFNTITESNLTQLTLWGGDNNAISKCNISSIFLTYWSNSNMFTKNNFFCDNSTDAFSAIILSTNLWDNGSIGNYWIDYLAKYPNVSETDNSGIGNTQNVIDQNNIDRHPLMYPYDIEKDQITLLGNVTVNDSNVTTTKPSSHALIVAVLAALIVVAVVGLIYYQKKHKN
jgi:hypothetical protein